MFNLTYGMKMNSVQPMKGNVKKRRPHGQLKSALIKLAEEIIEAEGLEGITARRLATSADISVGTIYNLFGHLDGVIRAVNTASLHLLHNTLKAALQSAPETVEDRLIAMAEAYVDFALSQPHRWDTLFRFRASTPADEDMHKAEALLFSLLADAAETTENPHVLRALWAAVHGVAELAVGQKLTGIDPDQSRRYARLIVQAGLRGLDAMRKDGLA
jgi:AcrR family transcriptional regulator